MSATKLTLNADAALIGVAKKLAAERNTSVSALFSRLVSAMGQMEHACQLPVSPLARKASGLATLPAKGDTKDVLAEALSDKYGF